MGRGKPEIKLDTSVSRTFSTYNADLGIGLLIGTINESSDFLVAHFAETLEDEKNENGESSDSDYSTQERTKTDFEAVPLNTLAFHAKQVMPMLPGGLSIVGLCAVDTRDNMFTFANETRVKSLVSAVAKGILKSSSWYSGDLEDLQEMLFMHYNPSTKKFAAKIFDCNTLKSRSSEINPQPLTWTKLESNFDTVAVMHVPKREAAAPLKKNLQSLMKSFHESLRNAKFLINGSFPSTKQVYREVVSSSELENTVEDLDGEELGFDESANESCGATWCKSKGGGDAPNAVPAPISPVHILFDKEPGILRCETPVDASDPAINSRTGVEDEFINHLHVQGKISIIAFVPDGSSTACMANRVRQDIIRSMSSRVVMHCESLIDEESTTEPIHNVLVHHEIPRRVFVQIPNSKLFVSDYLFPGDGPKDCLLSFRDILSIHIEDEDSILVDKEQPYSNDMQIRGSVEELLSQADSDMKFAVEGFGMRKMMLGVVMVLIIVILAFTLPQIFRYMTLPSTASNKHKPHEL